MSLVGRAKNESAPPPRRVVDAAKCAPPPEALEMVERADFVPRQELAPLEAAVQEVLSKLDAQKSSRPCAPEAADFATFAEFLALAVSQLTASVYMHSAFHLPDTSSKLRLSVFLTTPRH